MSSTVAGWIAIGALAVAVVALLVGLAYSRSLARVRRAQTVLLGSGREDLVNFAVSLQTRIDDLLLLTRCRMLAALEEAAMSDGVLAGADGLIERGLVRRAFDDEALEVWIPIDAPRTRLKDRLSALFVADYLNDPVAYGALYVCHRCEAVVFDANAKLAGMCAAHGRVSGIVAKGDVRQDVPLAVGDLRRSKG